MGYFYRTAIYKDVHTVELLHDYIKMCSNCRTGIPVYKDVFILQNCCIERCAHTVEQLNLPSLKVTV